MKIEVGGQIQGISLSSFLQIVQMDKTSCTLKIYSNDEVGYLWLHEGSLAAAETEQANGLDAVYDIICWSDTVIVIDSTPAPEHNITTPLMTILMEGLRLKDERADREAESLGMEDAPELPEADAESVDDQIAMSFVIDSDPSLSDEVPSMYSAPPSLPGAPDSPSSLSTKEEPAGEVKSDDIEAESGHGSWDYEYEDADEEPEPPNVVRTILMAFLIFITLSVLGFGGYIWYRAGALEKEYQSLITEITQLKEFQQQRQLLEKYLDGSVPNKFTTEVTGYLNEANTLIALDKRIEAMPRDGDFIKLSVGPYKEYLQKHRGTPFLQAVKRKIKMLPAQLDDIDYKKAQDAFDKPIDVRLGIYRTYLEDHPTGKYIREIGNLVAAVGDEYYFMFQQGTANCYKNRAWEACITIADTFISEFPEELRFNEIWLSRAEMIDQTELRRLRRRVKTLPPQKGKQLLLDYLQSNPNSTIIPEINKEIFVLSQKVEQIGVWEEVKAVANNQKTTFNVRIRELNNYIQQYPGGVFVRDARVLITLIETERDKASTTDTRQTRQTQQQIAEQKRIQEQKIALALKRQAEVDARQKRVAEAQLKAREATARARLYGLESRFTDRADGTISDSQSGLMWTLLDSRSAGVSCMDYNATRGWVRQINTGGYTDWRLPTPNELALLYNGKPWYPSNGVPWLWTSQVNTGAWGNINDTVVFDPNNKEQFTRDGKPLTDCGYVHAVRTP